jgi:Bacterial regulatory proteins, luxR family
MAEGRTNAAIAEALLLSRRAVEKHINSIFSKLWLTGNEEGHPRVQAVLIYLADLADLADLAEPAEAQPTRDRSQDRSGMSDVGNAGAVPRCQAGRTHLHQRFRKGHRPAGRVLA